MKNKITIAIRVILIAYAVYQIILASKLLFKLLSIAGFDYIFLLTFLPSALFYSFLINHLIFHPKSSFIFIAYSLWIFIGLMIATYAVFFIGHGRNLPLKSFLGFIPEFFAVMLAFSLYRLQRVPQNAEQGAAANP